MRCSPNPGSEKMAGARLTTSPTKTAWSGPASTVGATLLTVTVKLSEPGRLPAGPATRSTVTVTV